MRPAWQLATNSLSERRSRTALLVVTVALSAGLIAAVACAMASIHKGIEAKVQATVGAADLRVQHVGKRSFGPEVLAKVESWPEISRAVGRAQEAVPLRNPAATDETGKPVELTAVGFGVMVDREYDLRPQALAEGRTVRSNGEIALDAFAAKELKARVGDTLDVVRFGDAIRLTVVGIVKRPPLGMLNRPEVYVTLDTLGAISDRPGRLREIDILVRPGVDAEALAAARAGEFERGLLLRVASKITSGLDKNLQSSQIGMVIASALTFLSAAFIIMTGLTTNVNERQRELAVLRCIGAARPQLAESQLAIGAIVGAAGAVLGIPLGVAGAYAMVLLFPEQLPSGFAMSWLGVGLALAGSVGAGVLGAVWPAFRASRTSPLEALAVRARPVRVRGIVLTVAFGLLGVLIHYLIMSVPDDAQVVFWGDVTVGLPSLFTGYFLLGVPAVMLVVVLTDPLIGAALRLPPRLLRRTVLATPYRHGFTAGAMMVGLALLVAIWTNGRSIQRDWLGSLQFPDAFVNGLNLTEEAQRRIEAIPGVTDTCAITLQPLRTDAFGIAGLQRYNTTFVAFEPEPFFAMTRLTWIQPEGEAAQARARRRLEEGGAVLVAREFLITKGLGVGDTLTLSFQDTPYEFEIVGVVASPGLDIVSKFFDIGDEYIDQAVNAVFGARRDLKEKFGNDAINLIQIGLDPAADDDAVMKEVRAAVGLGIISAGSGREIKEEIRTVLGGSLLIFSVVAVAAMLVACFGVANLIVAGIQARQFEFGVLRAIGAQRSLLTRLILGEALIIALTACLLGTVMGIQSSWAGQRMYAVLLGLVLHLDIPWGPIAVGWATVIAITLAAAVPAVWRLAQREPRELLAAMKG